jgi:quercetin dioxygenase-like cupin family protein
MTPSEGQHAHGLEVVYLLRGAETLTTADGFELGAGPGAAMLLPAGALHTHANSGSGPSAAIAFTLTCGGDPTEDDASSLPLHASGEMEDFPIAAGLEQLTLRAGESGPGSQGPVVQHPGPVVYYVRSGETAISLADSVRLYREGEVFTIPSFSPYQYTNVGPATNRSLYLLLTPVGAPVSEVLPDILLPQP